MQMIGRMLMHKKQSKQRVSHLRAVQTRGRMQIYKVKTMQTILPSQVLSLIQQLWVTITMNIVSFQS